MLKPFEAGREFLKSGLPIIETPHQTSESISSKSSIQAASFDELSRLTAKSAVENFLQATAQGRLSNVDP